MFAAVGSKSPSIVLAVLAVAAGSAAAQDASPSLNGYVTLANGYWSRGLSQNDGLSVQAGIDYQHQSGWFAGAWAANVDYAVEGSRQQPREIEVDVYGGYHARGAEWSWTVTLGRYLYPDTWIRYDYTELSGTVGFRDRVFYTASYSDDFYAFDRAALNQELSLALPLRGDVEIGAALGRFDLAGSNIDYTHWNVGVSKLVRRVVVDLRYHDSGYDGAGWLGDPNANHYVLSVSYALRPKKPKL
jgi:uncharacterized protein (TIGR02001 family)